MIASVERVVGDHVEDSVGAGVVVGLAKILLMVRILLAAVMGSLEGTKLQKMESRVSPLKGELDTEDLAGDFVVVAVVASAMEMQQMVNAPGEHLSAEVELDVGMNLNERVLVVGIGELPLMSLHRRMNNLLMKERRLLMLRNRRGRRMLQIPTRTLRW